MLAGEWVELIIKKKGVLMTYDNIKRVLYIMLFIGLVLYQVVYLLRVRRDYKCLIEIAKSESVISEAKGLYRKCMIFGVIGITTCLCGICYFTISLFNN